MSFTTSAAKRERAIERARERAQEKRPADLERATRRREVQNRRARTRLAVEKRASVPGGHIRCEGCGAVIDQWDMGHVFGKGSRRAGLPEAWASQPELCAALCCARTWGDRIGDHEKLDRHLDAELEARLGWRAVDRLAERLYTLCVWPEEWTPLEAIRELLRQAANRGIIPDGR